MSVRPQMNYGSTRMDVDLKICRKRNFHVLAYEAYSLFMIHQWEQLIIVYYEPVFHKPLEVWFQEFLDLLRV